MLAERADIDIDHAFEVLRGYARSHNIRLAALAQDFLIGKVSLGRHELEAGRGTEPVNWVVPTDAG